MPTQPGTPGTPLDTKQAAAKFAGLIIESGPDDEPPEADAAAPSDIPAADEKPAPSETTPPEPSDSESPDEEPDASTVYTLQVDGEPVEVSLQELKESFTYKSHNTRTAQDLAEQKKKLEPEIRARVEQDLAAERAQYQQGLQTLVKALQKLQGEPDWVALRRELEPAQYLERKADWEAQRADLEQIKAHEREVAQQAEAAQAKQFHEYRRAEQDKLLAAVPEWADAEKAKAEHAKLIQSAKQYGYSEQEVMSVVDHRALLMLRDAMRYRELQREPTAQVRAKTAKIKTATPGTPARPRPNAVQEKLLERVAKTGRHRDAQAAIEALID